VNEYHLNLLKRKFQTNAGARADPKWAVRIRVSILFFLALRQLTPTSLSSELKRVLFIGTFEVITCHWTESKDSIGTQRMLLDLICDLVIQSRGVFSDFCYPKYIVDKLLELVREMVKGHNNPPHITEVEQELLDVDSRNCRDPVLQDKALGAIQHAARRR